MKSGASCITLFFSEKMMFFLFFLFYCHCNLFSCFLTDSYFFIQLPAFFFFLIPVILLFHPLFYNPVQNFHKLFRDSTLLPIWFVRLSFLILLFLNHLLSNLFLPVLRSHKTAELLFLSLSMKNLFSSVL